MKIGYARVSTDDQDLSLQKDALRAAGCRKIIEDHGFSGAVRSRPGLNEAMSKLKKGDVLVVWRLDRLGRSLNHLIEIIDTIGKQDAGFVSLNEDINTTTAGGRLVFHMMGALAQFERDLIGERTKAGMTAAKRRGKHVGRPFKLDGDHLAQAREWIASGEKSRGEVAKFLKVDVKTLRRALATNNLT